MDNYLVEEYEERGSNVKIYLDTCAENPREWDNLGTMVCFGRHTDLGDSDHGFTDPNDFIDWCKTKYPIILAIYLYDHSGLTIRTYPFDCPWDSSQIGWIYVEVDQVKDEFGWERLSKQRRRRIEEILRSEVEVYNQWITGEVYYYVIETEDHTHVLDSCGGFYGLDETKQHIRKEIELEVQRDVQRMDG